MHYLQINHDFTISIIHYPYLKTTSKIIPLKEASGKLGGQYAYEQQRNSIPLCFNSSKHDTHIECYKKFMMSSNIAKRKSEGEGTSTLNNTKRMQRSLEGAKKLFPKESRIFLYSAEIVPRSVDPANISWYYCQIH